jgi:hypothetical protein
MVEAAPAAMTPLYEQPVLVVAHRAKSDLPMALVAERIWPMAVMAVFTLTAASWLFRRKLG